MSIGSTLKKALGFVAGILIPGAKIETTDLVHSVQQEIADAMGEAATDLAEKLKVDTSGLSGSEKIFAITGALVATALAQGVQADLEIIEAVALDVAQAAFRKTLPDLETKLIALAASIASVGLKKVEQLVTEGVAALTAKAAG